MALVLGSGGVRGMAHVGVLEELEAAQIPIDIIVGCSAGSMVGALYADNPSSASVKKLVGKLKAHSVLDFDIWNCRYGLSQVKNMQRILRENIKADRFDQLQIPLVVVATDLHSGELYTMGEGELLKAVEASCSIPFVFVPCHHSGRVLVDGAVVNPVPVKVARDLGAQMIIAVDLCELLPKTFPTNLFQVAARSLEIFFMWQSDICTKQGDIIIRPKTCGVGSFDDSTLEQVYQAGKRAAREKIPLIKELIAKKRLEEKYPDGMAAWRLVQSPCYEADICR